MKMAEMARPAMNIGKAWFILGSALWSVTIGKTVLVMSATLLLKIYMLPIAQYPKNNNRIGEIFIVDSATLFSLSS